MLANGLTWNTAQLFNTGSISVINDSFIPGDFNRDGKVDGGDFASMMFALADLNNYKTANGLTDANLLTLGDINGSGSVNNADLEALRVSLVAKAGTFTLLPEPSTWVMALLSMPVLALFAHRRMSGCRIR